MNITDAESYAILDELFGGGEGPPEISGDSRFGMWLCSYQSPDGLRWTLCTSGGEAARLSAPSPGTTITVEWITGARLDDLMAARDAHSDAREQAVEMERYNW